ncbi:MAG: Maf family protein [Patescibacteria group bacterium]
MKIILGSSSKYRKAVLESAGYTFDVMSPDVDEMAIRSTDYYELPLILARAKSEAIIPNVTEPALVITGDVVVICDGELYEKPESPEQVHAWLKKYGEGYPAEISCGIVVVNTHTGKKVEEREITKILFSPIPLHVVDEFIATGDPFSKAGGFSVQLPILKPYIKEQIGSIDSMMGMPLHIIKKLLKEVQS